MSSEVQEDLLGLQNALLKTDSVEQFLHELAVLAAQTVNGAMSCGMALRQHGRPLTAAACSDLLASAADEAQYQAGDGPCLHAVRRVRPVRIDDTAASDRWPLFCRRAAELGVRSCYALPLVVDGQPIGALVLYARRPAAFGPGEAKRADRFASDASGALTLALRMASCADLNDQLRSSIDSRAVIDQALGVIMATEHCPQERALALLKSVSQNNNVRLRDLAASIVTSASGEAPQPRSPFEEDD
ncbi:MAG TPA: GAF and ANTAR domain-containing protein [Trebonia sp.]